MTAGRLFRDIALCVTFIVVVGSVSTVLTIIKLPLRLIR